MSRSTQSKSKRFFLLAVGTLAVAGAVGVLSWPQLQMYAAHRAADYAATASNEPSAQQAIAEYRLAKALDPGNATYRSRLASLYLTENQPDQAINVLGNTSDERIRKASLLMQRGQYSEALDAIQPLSTPAAAIARSQVYLEEGSDTLAAAAVLHDPTKAEQVQLLLNYLVAGEITEAQKLVKTNATPNPQLTGLQHGGLALAQGLYSRQLYRSTQRVLATNVDASPAKYLLLANTLLAEQPHGRNQLIAAQAAAGQGLKLDPANLSLHQLLHDIDIQLGDRSGADQQQLQITQLRTGAI